MESMQVVYVVEHVSMAQSVIVIIQGIFQVQVLVVYVVLAPEMMDS